LSPEERRAQRYLEGQDAPDVADPSVITLNGLSVSLATTDFMLLFTGLRREEAGNAAAVYYPLTRELRIRPATRREGCMWCDPDSEHGAFGIGDLRPLQVRAGHSREFRILPRRRLTDLRAKVIQGVMPRVDGQPPEVTAADTAGREDSQI
jgi:hypothetical protein